MTTIYILKLEHGCYYVGKTNNYNKRINDHLTNNGALWTKLHKVIGEEKLINDCSPFDEDKYVKEYMAIYGIDKVRGGSYVSKDLTSSQYDLLNREIRGANDVCTRCGRPNHFVKDCYAKFDIHNNIINDTITNTQTETVIKKSMCFKCGRTNHLTKDCYAKTTIDGDEIYTDSSDEVFCCSYCNKEFDTLKGATCHENLYCKLKPKYNYTDSSYEVFCCSYCNKEFDTLKGATCHENLYCKLKPKRQLY